MNVESRALQEFNVDTDNALPSQSTQRDTGGSEPVEEPRWRPSRTYQAMLLGAGFAMIFHVIGINSIYGIFQASYFFLSCVLLHG